LLLIITPSSEGELKGVGTAKPGGGCSPALSLPLWGRVVDPASAAGGSDQEVVDEVNYASAVTAWQSVLFSYPLL